MEAEMSMRTRCLLIFFALPGSPIFGEDPVPPPQVLELPTVLDTLPPRDDAASKNQLEIGRLILDGIQVAEDVRKLVEQKNYAEAEPLARRAVEIQRKIGGNEHLTVAAALEELAAIRHGLGRFASAAKLFAECQKIRAARLGGDPCQVAWLAHLPAKDDLSKPLPAEALGQLAGRLTNAELARGPEGADARSPAEGMLFPAGSKKETSSDLPANFLLAPEFKTPFMSHVDSQGRVVLEPPPAPLALASLVPAALASALTANSLEASRATLELVELNGRVRTMIEEGKFAEAEPIARKALELRRKTRADDHATSLAYLGLICLKLNRLDEAETHLGEFLRKTESAATTNPSDRSYCLLALAQIKAQTDHWEAAELLSRRSLQILEAGPGGADVPLAVVLKYLGGVCCQLKKFDEAESRLTRALAIYDKLGNEDADAYQVVRSLAVVYAARGRFADAEAILRRRLVTREKQFGKDDLSVAEVWSDLRSLYDAMRRFPEAEAAARRCLQIVEARQTPDHEAVGACARNLAIALGKSGNWGEAERLFQRSIRIAEASNGKDHPDTARELLYLAKLYCDIDREKDAEPLLKRCVAIHETKLGKEDLAVADDLDALAVVYQYLGRFHSAESCLKRSLSIREKKQGKRHADVAQVLQNLAFFYLMMGRLEEGEPLYLRSVDILEQR